jgi:hypothetical protein
VFFAILLISGYDILPRRSMYWETSSDCHNEAIANAMSRNRFDDIMRFLHLCDNSNIDTKDRFAKIRPLYTLLNERCLMFFPFDHDISINETMVPYFGRHPGKQFIRSKPVRFGFKLWSMCTSGGYAIQFEPYAGSKEKSSDRVDFGLGGSVVLDLLSEMPQHLPYNVAFDNFFTSIELMEHLGHKGIAATGTIRLNRLRNQQADVSRRSCEWMAEDTFSRTAQPSDAAPNVEKIREKCATSVKLGYIYIASMSFMELIKLHWLKYRQLKTICTQIIQKKLFLETPIA